jgi:methionyl-tRNA formyltransferase
MSKSQPLVFFGTEDFSAVSLEALIQAGFNVVLVITKPDHKTGRGQVLTAPKVKQIALAHSIEVLQPNDLDEVTDKITSVNSDFGVLVSYGKLIPKRTLDLFSRGIINVHPSLLPRWRGPSPIESTILSGDTKTGVSLIKLSKGMDEGPVYAQQEINLSGSETRLQLYEQLAKLGAELLVEKLPQIIDGELKPTSQDSSAATYSRLLNKQDGLIDWSEPSAVYEREVRAYLGFPKSTATLHGYHVIITKARVAKDSQDGALVMPCSRGFLEVLEVIAQSGHHMSGSNFLLGHKEV